MSSNEFRDDMERLAKAGQPMRVHGECGGVVTCPLCGASLVLAREEDGSLLVPEHDSCGAGGGYLVPVSDSPASGYRLIRTDRQGT